MVVEVIWLSELKPDVQVDNFMAAILAAKIQPRLE